MKHYYRKCLRVLYLNLLLLFSINALHAQSNLSGKVVDGDGTAIPGVTIKIENKAIGAVTNIEGMYALSLPSSEPETIVVSFVGYKTQRIAVNGRSIINVTLEPEISKLNEVVVTGSSLTQNRRELGNSITSINTDEINQATPANVFTGLQGKVAGAQITQNSGDPAGGFSVRLRGPSTISGSSDPLFVVDGVIIDNSSNQVTNPQIDSRAANIGQNRMVDINPNDIASMEIINGAAAAALYGSRASNGVVLITTKKGSAGETKFTVSTGFNVNQLRKKVFMNTVPLIPEGPEQRLWPILAPQPYNLVNAARFDYQDLIFDTGYGTDNYISARGGSSKTQFFTSLSYTFNEGIIRNTDFQRIGGKLSVTHELSSNLKLNFGINFINSSSNEKPDGNVFNSPINSINITSNTFDITQRDALGNLQGVEQNRINPLSIIEDYDITQETNRTISNFQLTYKPLEGLQIDFLVGADYYGQEGNTFLPRLAYEDQVSRGLFPDGYAAHVNVNSFQLNNDINATYNKQIGSNISSTTIAGFNLQYLESKSISAQGRDLNPFVRTVNGANTILPSSRIELRQRITGYFLQQTFGIKDKLYATLAGRIDGSTVFQESERDNFYPKVGLSYVLSEEDFFSENVGDVISGMKLRASYGEAGNLTAIGPYTRFTRFSTGILNGSGSFNLIGDQIGDNGIKVERLNEIEIGTEISFFENRAFLTFNYYQQTIEDLIVGIDLAASQGGTSVFTNVGEMENRGIELQLDGAIIQTEALKWNVNANFSNNKNKVTRIDLGEGEPLQIANQAVAPFQVREGEPLGVLFGTYFARDENGEILLTDDGLFQIERVNRETGEPARVNGQVDTDATSTEPGRRVLGDPNPDFILGFGTDLTFKGFSLGAQFESVQGLEIWEADERTRNNVGIGPFAAQELLGEVPEGYGFSAAPVEEFRVVDGSYTKLREAFIQYDFGNVGAFDNLVLKAAGRNLFSVDDFRGFDPEANSGGQSNTLRGLNFGAVPIPRSFIFTLTANF